MGIEQSLGAHSLKAGPTPTLPPNLAPPHPHNQADKASRHMQWASKDQLMHKEQILVPLTETPQSDRLQNYKSPI